MSANATTMSAYDQGYIACCLWQVGQHSSRNPYPCGDASLDWNDGWADATKASRHSLRGGFRVVEIPRSVQDCLGDRRPALAN